MQELKLELSCSEVFVLRELLDTAIRMDPLLAGEEPLLEYLNEVLQEATEGQPDAPAEES